MRLFTGTWVGKTKRVWNWTVKVIKFNLRRNTLIRTADKSIAGWATKSDLWKQSGRRKRVLHLTLPDFLLILQICYNNNKTRRLFDGTCNWFYATNLDTAGQTVPFDSANLDQWTTQQHKIKVCWQRWFFKFANGVKRGLCLILNHHITTSNGIVNTIKSGYIIPSVSSWPLLQFRNDISAIHNTDVVNEAVLGFFWNNESMNEVPLLSFVVKP